MGAPIQVVAVNRKAYHDYHIEETFEAGLVLQGTEVKAIREGRIQLRDSFARIEGEEAYLYCHIGPYSHGNRQNHDPDRPRKLLLHRHEILRLMGQTRRRGYTLVPLRVYFRRGWVKVELALARGRAAPDRREVLRRREAEREMDRARKVRLR